VVSQPTATEGKVSKNVESMQQKFDNELKNGTCHFILTLNT
jgi:hypothetical protein